MDSHHPSSQGNFWAFSFMHGIYQSNNAFCCHLCIFIQLLTVLHLAGRRAVLKDLRTRHWIQSPPIWGQWAQGMQVQQWMDKTQTPSVNTLVPGSCPASTACSAEEVGTCITWAWCNQQTAKIFRTKLIILVQPTTLSPPCAYALLASYLLLFWASVHLHSILQLVIDLHSRA